MKKSFLAVLLVIAMVVSMTSCGKKTEQTTGTSTEQTQTSTPEKYALLIKPLSNVYWMAVKNGVEAWAKENNVTVDVYAAESEENIAGQLSQMEDIIGKKYNGIALAPLSSVNLISGIVKANKEGIPVVNVDEGVDLNELKAQGGTMVGFVTTDNKIVGQKAAKFIVDKIGTGDVAIIEGTTGNVTSNNRVAGSKEYFSSVSGIKVVASQPGNWDRVKALDVATNIMQSNPNLKAFYCANDNMAMGVFQAVQNAGKTDKIIVVGTDATEDAKASISEGKMSATVGQANVDIAISCIKKLIDANASGYTATAGAEVKIEYIDSFLVTKENVAEYMK
jgi:D-allose transport system substrate-binding protein